MIKIQNVPYAEQHLMLQIRQQTLQLILMRRKKKPSDDAFVMSEFFKALSDPTRLNMVHAMLLHKWLCVSDIASLVGLSKSAVSHQLAYMRINKLVRVKREGRKVFYALNDSHVESVFALALSHIKE